MSRTTPAAAAAPEALFMRRAVALARKGEGRTSPNPIVGAVIVKAGRVIAEGFHKEFGGPHAEIAALSALKGASAAGAIIYCTLEPCSHFGKTPPCADAIIRSGIKRVVVGAIDPNPLVAGRGIRRLRRAGLEVVTGVCAEECAALNPAFNKFITSKRPYVTLKSAATLDGRIATSAGDSRWITGDKSRRHVHRMRAVSDVIITGVGTILKDDPELTVRGVKGLNPRRVVLDASFKSPLIAKVFRAHATDRGGLGPIVFTTRKADAKKIEAAKEAGIDVFVVKASPDGVDLRAVLKRLGELGASSALVEAGGTMNASFIRAGLVDDAVFFIAPKVIGGDGVPSVRPIGILKASKAIQFKTISIKRFDDDIMIRCVPA